MDPDGRGGYLGSATVVTSPGLHRCDAQPRRRPIPSRGGDSFVGQAWNLDGCWVLASTISAEAGASLPVQSTLIGLPGQANGEWIVAFNGPAGQTGNWQSMVTAGEMIVIGTARRRRPHHHLRLRLRQHRDAGGQHHLCEQRRADAAIPANDGSSADVIDLRAASGVAGIGRASRPRSVVIYELDTPIVTAAVTSDSLACLRLAIAGLAVFRYRSGQHDDHLLAGLRHGHQRRPGARRCRLQRPLSLGCPDRRLPPRPYPCSPGPHRDHGHARGARVQRQLLGRLGVAERGDHCRHRHPFAAGAGKPDVEPDLDRRQGCFPCPACRHVQRPARRNV